MRIAQWRELLADAPFTELPRWVPEGAAVRAEHRQRGVLLPDDLVARVTATAREAGVTRTSVLLAAHHKVIAVLTGEREVVTGYRLRARGDALPCRVPVADGSWRTLLREAAGTEGGLSGHADTSLFWLRQELRRGDPLFEIVLDVSGWTGSPAGPPEDDCVLWVSFDRDAGGVRLRLRYRDDVADDRYAQRLVGYYLEALRTLTGDLDAQHHRHSLLGAGELRLQLHGLAGPRRELPDRRFHDLFTERAQRTPGAVALVHRGRKWTYREVDLLSNRIANSLLAGGLRAEDVVAVTSERTAEWLGCVLGVFKAGGAYLPLDPAMPAARTATVLRRGGARFVLAQQPEIDSLAGALDGVRWTDGVRPHVLTIADAIAKGVEAAPEIEVGAGQLAYIYFTSGSTGEPKGAMCEHAGMLNHLLAKTEDLGIGADDVVVQNAPQCFDISLWQLIAPLLTGGRTLLLDTEAILDTRAFVDEIVSGGATVLQLVPSYLEVMLSYLDDEPRGLGALRAVCVTGEAIKKELVERWFEKTGITLVNAYGATEASDDTTHEVMEGVPEQVLVPLGGPVRNVHVYVLDEHLSLVPLGSPGEIAFSGVCVGRGYVNDEERTRLAFVRNPYQPDRRMYRTGDYGRWLPGGTLEFLGRRDEQVKIRGFRIEIGEIEDRLLRMPGVSDAAVVVEETTEGSKNLVAFYAAADPLSARALKDFLGAVLPEYMVPAYFHRLDALPLTANGKTDKKALARLAGTLGHGGAQYAAPSTPSERRLAAAWAEVLGVAIERIGRADHFFELGATSLSAVRLVVKLDRAISLTDLAGHPVLADLAAVLDGEAAHSSQSLHLLSASEAGAVASVVCLPYAGGNAVNYRPLATALEGTGYAVYGVELPGHDLSREGEAFGTVEEIAERVADEIGQRIETPVVLFGHDAGAAPALAVARLLGERGIDLSHVFVAGRLLGDEAALRREAAAVETLSDADVKALLASGDVYVELDGSQEERTDLVGAAYRHDTAAAARYLLEAHGASPAPRFAAPLSVLVADDDPATEDHRNAYHEWKLFADEVDLRVVEGGGHYFPRTRSPWVANALLSAIAPDPLEGVHHDQHA